MVLLAFDLGTTGCKASAFSIGGRLLSTAYHPYATFFPKPGHAVQRPESWLSAILGLSKQLIEALPVDADDISCISLSGHMNGCVPVDRSGQPLVEETMLWADERAKALARDLVTGIGWPNFYEATGAGLDTWLYPAAKIAWIKSHEPALYKSTFQFVGTKDVIGAWLTGNVATDYSDASNTGLMNIRSLKWDSDLCSAFGVDREKLPNILRSTDVLGPLRREQAQLLGLREGIPVVIGAGDVACASAGAGSIAEGTPYACLGSAVWVSQSRIEPLLDPAIRAVNICHVIPGLYATQLISYTAGIAYKWLRDQILGSPAVCNQDTALSYKKMDQLAASVPAGSGGVIFVPSLRPGGAPYYDPETRGAFLGLNLTTTAAHLLRAVLEGVAMNIHQLFQQLTPTAQSVPHLRLIGGGAEGALWPQIIADVLGTEVHTLTAMQEANTVGAALAGGVGIGALSSFDEVARFTDVAQRFFPSDDQSIYKDASEVFSHCYGGLRQTNAVAASLAALSAESNSGQSQENMS